MLFGLLHFAAVITMSLHSLFFHFDKPYPLEPLGKVLMAPVFLMVPRPGGCGAGLLLLALNSLIWGLGLGALMVMSRAFVAYLQQRLK